MNFKVRYRRFIANHLGLFVDLVYKFRIKLLSFRKPPIVILTIGKVGSSSIYKTLKKKTPNKVFHIHNLSKQGISRSIDQHLSSDRKSKPLHLIVSKYLSKKLSHYNGRTFVITVIREPISREVSSFFQNIEFYKNTLESKNLDIDIDKAHKILSQRLKEGICEAYEDWFKLEIESNYNINVFSELYDENKNYMIFRGTKTTLLLLRMEDLDEVFPYAIQEFLSLDKPMSLLNSNVGNSKYYAETYKIVKKELKLDLDTINQIVNSKFFNHFYLNDKDKVLKKWTKNY